METAEKIIVGVLLTAYFIGFMLKNIVTVKRTKQVIKGKSGKVNLLILNSTILYLITYFCIFFNQTFLVRFNILNSNLVRTAGLIFISLAFILGISTLISMKNSWRVGIRTEQKTDLILHGPFVFSRNPYFLSYNIIFLGIFFVFPSLVFLIFYIPFVVNVHLMILDEEKYLSVQHGDSYLKYKASVNRYFGLKFKKKV